ncbi:MAG: hypothetical protein LLG37_05700 [Spirochaetia bacterium]|nr:hypothetical protein [Spirochaetia bacterium]
MNTDNNGTADSWKVRFSTGITGNWSYVLHIKDITGEYTDTVRNFAVTTSSSKGFIRKSAVNSHYFSYENCGVFWGIGHNNGYLYSDSLRPQCVENPTMNNMNQNGDNVLLFWINTPWRTPWNEAQRTPMENQNDGLLNYNQRSAKFIDDKLIRPKTTASNCSSWYGYTKTCARLRLHARAGGGGRLDEPRVLRYFVRGGFHIKYNLCFVPAEILQVY